MEWTKTVYTFEDADGGSVTDWTTDDYHEAKEYARTGRCRMIENVFQWHDAETILDFTVRCGDCNKDLGAYDEEGHEDPEHDEVYLCDECFNFLPECASCGRSYRPNRWVTECECGAPLPNGEEDDADAEPELSTAEG